MLDQSPAYFPVAGDQPWTQPSWPDGGQGRPCARAPTGRTASSRFGALYLLKHCEAGGEATLTNSPPNDGSIFHLPSFASDADQAGLASKVPGRRLYALAGRILLSWEPLLQSICAPRAALLEAGQPGEGETVHLPLCRRCRGQVGCAKRATPCPLNRQDRQLEAPTRLRSARPLWRGLPEERCAASSLKYERFTDTHKDFGASLNSLRRSPQRYANDREEFSAGVICVGRGHRDKAPNPVSARSALVPSMRATRGAHRADAREISAARARCRRFREPSLQPNGESAQAANCSPRIITAHLEDSCTRCRGETITTNFRFRTA